MISCWDTLRKKIKNSCSHGLIVLKKNRENYDRLMREACLIDRYKQFAPGR